MGDGEDAAWAVRDFVYGHVVAQGVPPTIAEAVAGLGIEPEAARAAYRRLGARHGIVLQPGGEAIRMAKPFSGVPTPFRVRADGRDYWANCALDALGVAAALRADAEVEAGFAEDGAAARLGIEGGRVKGDGVVHVLTPFRAWDDDMVET